MHGALALAALFGATALAGCFGGFGVSPDFGDLTLEASVDGADFRTGAVNLTAELPPATIDPGTISPLGGGGRTLDLPLPAEAHKVAVRFRDPAHLAQFEVHWRLRDPVGDVVDERDLAGDQPFEATVTGLARLVLQAEVGRGLRVDTQTRSLDLRFNGHWQYAGRIHPIRAPNGPAPANYGDMTDTLRFTKPLRAGDVRMESHFRGAYVPGNGTDIDLALRDATGSCFVAASGPTTPDPQQANETLAVPLHEAGLVSAAVGAIPAECRGTPYYTNPTPVPFRLDLWLLGPSFGP